MMLTRNTPRIVPQCLPLSLAYHTNVMPRFSPGQEHDICTEFLKHVAHHAKSYSFDKYPPDLYASYREAFGLGKEEAPVREALLWKYGKAASSGYPKSYATILTDADTLWKKFLELESRPSPKDCFKWWISKLGVPKSGRPRFITAAFVTHLVHGQDEVPIIDQHNFRAAND